MRYLQTVMYMLLKIKTLASWLLLIKTKEEIR